MNPSPNSSRSAVAAAVLLLAGVSSATADVILNGNYLRVGVHTSGGLIDDNFTVGIDFDKNGTSAWTGFDFLKPGTSFEFYSLGYAGNSAAAGYYYGNTFGASTVDTSAGGVLSTVTTGAFNDLGFTQTLTFNANSGVIDFSVTLHNNSNSAMENVVYARGLDPDQDVYAGGGYPTSNAIINPNLVVGSAPITDWTIGIFSNSVYAHTATVRSSWPYGDPYGLLTPRNDGNGDYSINMAWDIGTLAAGASATVNFEYRIGERRGDVVTPGVPDAASTLGLLTLGLAGIAACRRRLSVSRG